MDKSQIPNKIDHIGIAVRSIKDTLPFYVDHLHLQLEAVEELTSENVRIAFLRIGESRIELLEALSEESVISKFIQKHGEGIHHIALGVNDIVDHIRELKNSGIKMVHNQPKQGAGGARVAFIHPKEGSGVLYELCENQNNK